MEREAYVEMAATEERHWWFQGRRKVVESVVAGELAGKKKSELLEIGAGTGGNLQWLSKYGRVSAVEMDDAARAIARRKTGIDVAPGSLPRDLPFNGEVFDVVVLLDVLEHVDDDVAALRAIGPLIGSSGKLVLTVPACPWLWGPHDVFLHHKRRYTRKSLVHCASTAGLSVDRVTHFNSLLFPVAVAARAISRFTRQHRSAESGASAVVMLNAALARIFGLERSILKRMNIPFGLSLMAILGQRRGGLEDRRQGSDNVGPHPGNL